MASTARIEELKKKFDENPRRYFAPLANEYRKAGDLDQAIALCRAHLPQQPGHISGHIVLAQALYEARDLGEAQQIFSLALELDPENLIALRFLGDIARETGDVGSARGWYSRVLDVDPRNDEISGLIRSLDQTPVSAPAVEYQETTVVSTAVETAPYADEAEEPSHSASTAAPEGAEGEPRVESHAAMPETEDQFPEIGDEPFMVEEYPATPIDENDPFGMPSPEAQTAYEDALFHDISGLSPNEEFDAVAPAAETPSATTEQTWQETIPEPVADDASSFPSLLDETISAFDAPLDVDAPVASAQPDAMTSESEVVVESYSASIADDDIGTSTFDDAFASFSTIVPEAPRATPDASVPAEVADESAASLDTFDIVDGDQQVIESFEPEAASTPAEPVVASHATPTGDWPAVPGMSVEELAPAEPEMVSHEVLGLEVMEFTPTTASTALPPTPVVAEASAPAQTPDAFVTETMAELYLQQGFRDEALEVYRQLLERNPHDANLRERVEQLESGSTSSISAAMLSENVIESALRRQTERPGRSVRAFFAALASKRPPARALRHEVPADMPAEEEPRSIDTLFAGTAVPARDTSAAATLATAFQAPDAPGRPSREATSELSLDRVFRSTSDEPAAAADPAAGSFSFDQFFSDPETGGEETVARSASSVTNTSDDRASDIEQFTAWLEGLKRK